jgi:hypothetical protein
VIACRDARVVHLVDPLGVVLRDLFAEHRLGDGLPRVFVGVLCDGENNTKTS